MAGNVNNNGWGTWAFGIASSMATGYIAKKAISYGISYVAPGLQTALKTVGVAGDVLQYITGYRSYDPSTCIGRFNICADSVTGGSWWSAGLGMMGCSLAYAICKD